MSCELQLPTYVIENAAGAQTGTFTTPIYTTPRPNTTYGGVYEVTNGTNSYYDALSVTFEKRVSHGFQSLALLHVGARD